MRVLVAPAVGRAVVLLSGAGLALAGVAGPASAATDVNLQKSHEGKTASEFQSQEDDCGNDAGEDGWHFVAPSNAEFTSMTLTFDLLEGPDLVVMLDDNPDTEFGKPDDPDDNNHAYVVTPAGATLLSGTATVAQDDIQHDFFVLSHTCPGEPSDGPSDGPSDKPPDGPSDKPSDEPSDRSTTPTPTEQGDTLPKTGAGFPTGAAAALALLLLATGGFLLTYRKGMLPIPLRRRH